jgi:4-amino-4-deoxy-L-arabinose transferase-like glycosyltransferase
VFAGTTANYQHLDYPLLVPSLIAWGDGISGHADDTTAHVLLVSLVLAMLAIVGWAANRLAGPVAGLAAVLLTAGLPHLLSHWSTFLMADAPVAAFAVSLLLVLALWLTFDDRRLLVVAVAIGAGGAATKVEGMLFALAAFAGLAICARGRRRPVGFAAAAVIATALPWMAWTRIHHIESDLINSNTLNAHHLRVVAPYAGLSVRQLLHFWPGGWPLALVAFAVLAVMTWLARTQRGVLGYLGLAWAFSVLGLWAQYVISAGQVLTGSAGAAWLRLHFASSAARVLLVPAITLAIAVTLGAGGMLRRGEHPVEPPTDPAKKHRHAADLPG